MGEISGRKLFRSPFPPGRPARTPDSSLGVEQAQQYPVRSNALADAETQKTPSVPLEPLRDSALANAETREIPVSFPAPSPMPNVASAPKKTRYAQVSKRRKVLLMILTVALLIPSCIAIFEIINAAILYQQVQDGMAHLQAAEALFRGSSGGGVEQYFDMHKLRQAQGEIDAARGDFVSLSAKLDHDGTVALASALWPAQVSTMRSLGHIANDGTAAAQILIKTVIDIAPSLAPALQKSPASTNATALKPYITPASFQEINKALDAITPLVQNMNLNARGVALNTLPISSSQRQMLASVLPLLPQLAAGLAQEHGLSNALGWFLGIDQQRTFLIEPMDSSELRATGGFTGQFGELTLNGGHVGPLHLENIGKYEEDHTAEGSPPDTIVYPKVVGQMAPAPYSAWWPVANFGLRDSNLSADFPTSASIAMQRYAYEFGSHVDGVIIFTPMLIQQILHVTGPITIPAYHETITEQNLVERLHYYQLDNTGIRQEEIIEHVDDPQVARKLFTQRVTTTLIGTVSHLPFNKLLPMANEMLQSMKSKDLQIYVTNAQIESLIGKYGSTAALDRSTNHDGLFIVQSNLSASKASQYVATSIQDTIALDAQGGATHHLQMTLDYQQKGDVFGFDTYRDYVRVYVPANSQLLTGNGFDQYARPYCGDVQSAYRLCQSDVYGDGSLVCAPPIAIGFATSYVNDPYAGRDHPLDMIGPPQNMQSDEAGRAMFGGWVVIPKNCTMIVTLSWYVPPMGQNPYDLLLQAQASVYAPLNLTIQPAQATCTHAQGNALHFSAIMNGEDRTFAVRQQRAKCTLIATT